MRSIDKLKVQTTQDDIDCNYKIVTFFQNILLEIKITSCTKKFPSINGSWQSAHTKQVGCHWRSKNENSLFYATSWIIETIYNLHGNVLANEITYTYQERKYNCR